MSGVGLSRWGPNSSSPWPSFYLAYGVDAYRSTPQQMDYPTLLGNTSVNKVGAIGCGAPLSCLNDNMSVWNSRIDEEEIEYVWSRRYEANLHHACILEVQNDKYTYAHKEMSESHMPILR